MVGSIEHAPDAPGGVRRVVVIGAGPAAHRVVDALVARSAAGSDPLEITVIGEESHAPYDRVALSKRLDGPVDLSLGHPESWHGTVRFRSGTRAVHIDPKAGTVAIARVRAASPAPAAAPRAFREEESATEPGNGLGATQLLPYDELVLATGSSATVPPIVNAAHGRVYRTIDDVDEIVAATGILGERLGRPANVVVVGGGLLGLEAAGGLHRLGARTAVVHSGRWLMSSQLDEGAGQALGRIISGEGIDLHLGRRPTEIAIDASGSVTAIVLTDGTRVPADFVIFSIGITPRDELARAAGLVVAERGGVVVAEDCSTSAPHVWAIGEVASIDGSCVGLVAPANAMAEVVADRIAGGDAVFPGIDDATKLKLAGVEVASFGDAMGRTERALEVVYADPARGLYQKVVVADDAKTLLGGIFVGDASPYASLRPLLGRELPAEAGAYLSTGSGEAPAGGELPDDAQVCSCNNVSVGTVRAAVVGQHGDHADGCVELGALKSCTRAGTQCGSCVPLVKKLLETELVKAGKTVSKALCEHVTLSRSELFESVRVLGLRSADEVMQRFGAGLGCDVCKPVIASVLASQTSGYILDDGAGPLQDTNDRALANMQKDGTYSVVPRIPGGEITPQKLKVIADVAADYDLYTKITGGQRIDLFGARLEQLPEIWKILVDAGFESGQAYGKSLRTVKSCVGSTWCRYGVQDAVSMAIGLELRYRGLRSPHKFKLGVSGCARECAEARSKDIGVIATDQGWNLYVGGNGGFQPAHAQLLAQDLDDETLIRYIDRFVMYYVRTADRLQRTARWIEALDGGLDHVRDVVCDDSLGIADDLEQAMASHVDSYEDEWAATLKDPERLRRFRSFVNAPSTGDPAVVRVRERGQLRPATLAERSGDTAVLVSGPSIPMRPAGSGSEV
ncbi:nitrite reductase large subunit NirB [Herbiconiux sp. P17]|uniref:nitrite reductase large subunit NirB n=1 Tax=Herbiconiux wuyangfengii TaxID=3342794 RepID=UPI0035BB3FA6